MSDVRGTGGADGGRADRPVRDLLAEAATPGAALGGGSIVALAAAGAAALVERCAAATPGREDARARSAELRARCTELVDDDAAAFARLLASRTGDDRAAAAVAASGPPRQLRDAAAELLELATDLERTGAPRLRGEARCAVLLADAAVRTAEAIVRLNDRLGEPGA